MQKPLVCNDTSRARPVFAMILHDFSLDLLSFERLSLPISSLQATTHVLLAKANLLSSAPSLLDNSPDALQLFDHPHPQFLTAGLTGAYSRSQQGNDSLTRVLLYLET